MCTIGLWCAEWATYCPRAKGEESNADQPADALPDVLFTIRGAPGMRFTIWHASMLVLSIYSDSPLHRNNLGISHCPSPKVAPYKHVYACTCAHQHTAPIHTLKYTWYQIVSIVLEGKFKWIKSMVCWWVYYHLLVKLVCVCVSTLALRDTFNKLWTRRPDLEEYISVCFWLMTKESNRVYSTTHYTMSLCLF